MNIDNVILSMSKSLRWCDTAGREVTALGKVARNGQDVVT
jgi:hypothetical protein